MIAPINRPPWSSGTSAQPSARSVIHAGTSAASSAGARPAFTAGRSITRPVRSRYCASAALPPSSGAAAHRHAARARSLPCSLVSSTPAGDSVSSASAVTTRTVRVAPFPPSPPSVSVKRSQALR